jgi:hypothetical protein
MAYAAIFKLLSCMMKLALRKRIFTSFEETVGKVSHLIQYLFVMGATALTSIIIPHT